MKLNFSGEAVPTDPVINDQIKYVFSVFKGCQSFIISKEVQ